MITQESQTSEAVTKTILITGANSGIGFELTKAFVSMNHHVVMICRDKDRGESAKEKILQNYPDGNLDLVLGDLSSNKETKKLAIKLLKQYPAIDILIHNAGIWKMKRDLNEDGLEETFMVNYLSMFILNYYLLPNVMKSIDPRIILINAGLYVNGTFDPDKTPYGLEFSKIRTYADSKFCGILFLTYFSKLIQDTKYNRITIFGIHPGVFRTNLGIYPSFLGLFVRFAKLFMKSSKKSVPPVQRLCFGNEINEFPNGQYFDVFKPEDKITKAHNDTLATSLWQLSEKLTAIDWKNVLEN